MHFFHSIWKNLHLTENFYTDMSVVSVTNMRYGEMFSSTQLRVGKSNSCRLDRVSGQISIQNTSLYTNVRTRACWYTHSNILGGHQYSWCVQLQAQGTSIENPGRSLTTIPKTIIATEKHPSSQSKDNIEPPSLFIGKTPIHLFIMKVQETKWWSFDMHLACVQSNPPSAPYGPPWTLFHGGFKLKVLSEWSTLHCIIFSGLAE